MFLFFLRLTVCLFNIKKRIDIESERERERERNKVSELLLLKMFERAGEEENHFSNILVCLSLTYNKYVTNIILSFFSPLMFYPSIYLSFCNTLNTRERQRKKRGEGGASLFAELTQIWSHIRSYLVYKQHNT